MDSSLLGSVLLSEMWNVSKTGVILSSPSLEGKMFGRNQKWLVKTTGLKHSAYCLDKNISLMFLEIFTT